MIITFISDTHTKHKSITKDLPGGDLLIHCGDFMNSGYSDKEFKQFLDWLNSIHSYQTKVFIGGNHDRYLENYPNEVREIMNLYPNIIYLQDTSFSYSKTVDESVSIWGSPWQPEFNNWAFNLPRGGEELERKWDEIPNDIDILITHGPPQKILDTSGAPFRTPLLGCEKLAKRVKKIKPKLHAFGHIHGSYGYYCDGYTHFINAAILNERYEYTNTPITVDWDKELNKLSIL